MRILVLFLVFVFSAGTSFADLYVIYEESSGAIYTISEKDDTVIPDGYSLKKFPGNWDDYNFDKHPSFYDIKKDKFILNVKRESDLETKVQKLKKREEEASMIEKKALLIAKKQLESEGEIFEEVKDSDFESKKEA